MTAVMISLLAWLGANTNYAIPQSERELPRIEYRTLAELQTIHGFAGRDVWATYNHRKNTVYLRTPFHADDPVYRSVLLHELVHFLQATNGKLSVCRGYREAEAYALEFRWLQERGFTQPLHDPFMVKMLEANCSFPADGSD